MPSNVATKPPFIMFIRIARVIILLSCLVLVLLALATLILLFIAFGSLSYTIIGECALFILQAGFGFYGAFYKSRPALLIFTFLCSLSATLVTVFVIVDTNRHYSQKDAKQLGNIYSSSKLNFNLRTNNISVYRSSPQLIVKRVAIESDTAQYYGMVFQWITVGYNIILAILSTTLALSIRRASRRHLSHDLHQQQLISQQPADPQPPLVSPFQQPIQQAQQQQQPSNSSSSYKNKAAGSRRHKHHRKSPASPPAPSQLSPHHISHLPKSSGRKSMYKQVPKSPPSTIVLPRFHSPQSVAMKNQMMAASKSNHQLQMMNENLKSVESNHLFKAMTRTGSIQMDQSP